MGMTGPWKSESSIPTKFGFSRAKATARFAVTVDLPTPPLPLITMMMRFTFFSLSSIICLISRSLLFSVVEASSVKEHTTNDTDLQKTFNEAAYKHVQTGASDENL